MDDKTTNVCQEDIYKKIFYLHSEKLFRFLVLKFNNEDLARDSMQEAFIVLWENCKKITLNNAKSYIFTVGRNKAIDIIRKEKTHLRIVEDDKIPIMDEPFEDNSDQLKKVNSILSKLPQASKEVFLMNRINEMTYAEIAKELDISVKAVEKRMSIALKIIREN